MAKQTTMRTRPADQLGLRQANGSRVLRAVREHGPISRADVGRRLGLSPATISRIAEDLLRADFVVEDSPIARASGRPANLLRYNPSAQLVIGIDLGGSKVAGVLANSLGDVLAESRRHLHQGVDAETTISSHAYDLLCDVIDELIARAADEGTLRGIAVGAPGVVSADDGLVLRAPHLRWVNFPLVERLTARYNTPVIIDNDVNVAALAEARYGAGRELQDLVCLYVGSGVGAGLVLRGELYRGHRWGAGEIGHVVPGLEWLNEDHSSGLGALETLITGPGIVNRARRLGMSAPSDAPLVAAEVFAADRRGDPVAGEVIDFVADALSVTAIAIAAVLDPALIVLGGGVMSSYDQIASRVQRAMQNALPVVPQLSRSSLGARAAARGAAALALESTDDATLNAVFTTN